MPLFRRLVVLLTCACALAFPASAVAEPWWEKWPENPAYGPAGEPGQDDEGWTPAVDDELPEPEYGAWFEDLEDGGDEAGVEDSTAPAPAKKKSRPTTSRPSSSRDASPTTLQGVRYRKLIIRYAKRRSLDPALVAAVIHAESNFNRRAVSPVGARGLMQLMPATARGMGAKVSRLFDARTNISYGTRYLRTVRRLVGPSTRLMAAAYNAGPGAVRRYGGVPPYAETRHYVTRVIALRAKYRKLR